MKIYAVYRILYGEDFVQESIRSIEDIVDRVFVFWDDTPWGDVTSCMYKGVRVEYPVPVDNVKGKIEELKSPKVEMIYDHVKTNIGQFTHLVNDLILPDYDRPEIVFQIEPDHVLRKDQADNLIPEFESLKESPVTTPQVSLWRVPSYHIPMINPGLMLWDLRKYKVIPPTGRHANLKGPPRRMKTFNHNLGACITARSMYWKHLLCIGFSPVIGDTLPSESWYEEKWLGWDPLGNNADLHPSTGHESTWPKAIPYPIEELPELIQERYGYERALTRRLF